jgi:hypothetical protein
MEDSDYCSDFEESGADDGSEDEFGELMEGQEPLPELPDPGAMHIDPALLDPTRHVGFDPAIVHGKLQNGLTYFVKKNANPQQRADLQLIMNVGSVDERDDEQGYAHFVEHLAFRGNASQ